MQIGYSPSVFQVLLDGLGLCNVYIDLPSLPQLLGLVDLAMTEADLVCQILMAMVILSDILFL